MRQRTLVAVVVGVMVLALGAAAAMAAKPAAPTAPGGRYLVVFKTDTLPSNARAIVADSGGAVVRTFDQIGVLSAAGNATFVKNIAKSKNVLAVGPEHMYTLPPTGVAELTHDAMVPEAGPVPGEDLYYGYQWDIRRIGAPAVWDRFPLSYPDDVIPRVAVLDVGVMNDHPDLDGQVDDSVATSYCQADLGNPAGYPDYTTFIDFDTYPAWEPGVDPCTPLGFVHYEWHGTHVAGTIAAKFGGGGVVGVAPDAKVGAYKVFDIYLYEDANGFHLASGAFDGPIFSAIIDATEAGYPVISMSLGGYVMRNDKADNASYLAWDRVAKWANRMGALIVASAGNGAADLNGPLAHVPSDLPTVVSTSATATSELIVDTYGLEAAPGSDILAAYSNHGAAVDIAAPGGDLGPEYDPDDDSTWDWNYAILSDYITSAGAPGYAWSTGTSMATPHVSAVAAWVRALYPGWTPGAVRSWLKETAQYIGSRQEFGHGMVDADTATE